MNEGQALWSRFWSGLGARQGGCLPNAPDVHEAVRGVWTDFARTLPKRARVLDIGTGNGAVLMQLRQVRSDLQLLGVDSADRLPKAPPGIKLKPNVMAEQLPFGDSSFNAATSQFAFEYSEMTEAGAELFRILAQGSSFLMIIHDQDSTLARDNRARAAALEWFRGTGLLAKAEALTRARRMICLPTPSEFAQKVREARSQFPDLESAQELAYWVFETLERGQSLGPDATFNTLAQIDALTREELGLLQELHRAGLDERQVREVARRLSELGFDVQPPQHVLTARGPLAWRIAGSKPASK
jgi:ubiquinone/menaquinone biosynthesis C-methylase UbiE